MSTSGFSMRSNPFDSLFLDLAIYVIFFECAKIME
jgi:hypothetical protein